jgi:type III pantothenate kinase
MKQRICGLFAVDIGNSTIGLGFYPDVSKEKPLVVNTIPWRTGLAETLSLRIEEFLQNSDEAFPYRDIGVVISSVVPALNRKVITAVKGFCKKPLILDYRLAGGLSFEVPHPETIGSDRIANALAGFRLIGKPMAVVDFGTATTITVVDKRATFQGGAILPGIDMMREALASGTAKLPEISIATPRSVLGKDTVSAITSGIIHGTAGAVDGIIKRLENESGVKLSVALTGGRAALVSPYMDKKHVLVPHLIFEGMRLIFSSIYGTCRP